MESPRQIQFLAYISLFYLKKYIHRFRFCNSTVIEIVCHVESLNQSKPMWNSTIIDLILPVTDFLTLIVINFNA